MSPQRRERAIQAPEPMSPQRRDSVLTQFFPTQRAKGMAVALVLQTFIIMSLLIAGTLVLVNPHCQSPIVDTDVPWETSTTTQPGPGPTSSTSQTTELQVPAESTYSLEEAMALDLPYVIQTTPRNGAEDIPLTTCIDFVFSTSVELVGDEINLTVIDAERHDLQVPVAETELLGDTMIRAHLAELLTPGRAYTAVLAEGACRSLNGTKSLQAETRFKAATSIDMNLVEMNFSFGGLDYDKFMANATLVSALRRKLVEQVGNATGAEDIRISFTNGSILATATVIAETESAVETVAGNLEAESQNSWFEKALLDFVLSDFGSIISNRSNFKLERSKASRKQLQEGFPKILHWSKEAEVGLDEILEVHFSEPIQRGFVGGLIAFLKWTVFFFSHQ